MGTTCIISAAPAPARRPGGRRRPIARAIWRWRLTRGSVEREREASGMHKVITIGALATLCLGVLPPAIAQVKRPAGHVQAAVTFTGRGTVDETRRIWVFLFDTPAPGRAPNHWRWRRS